MSWLRGELLAWLALLLPLAALSLWAASRAAARRSACFGARADDLAPGFSRSRRLARDGLLSAAVGLVVVALAGPQVGTWMREVLRRGVDVMVVLDTSRSMLARDMGSSRLERAKRDVRGLLENLSGHRVGLVAFAGDARRISPLTHDPNTYRLFLDDVDTNTCALGGTAVGEGLEQALDGFDPELPHQRAIVLLTDGEDHTSDPPPTEVAYRALALGVPIHVVAYGTAEGAPMVVFDAAGRREVVRDAEGNPVISRPDADLLRRIANTSGGAFLSAEDAPFPLDEIWDKRISRMEGVTRASSQREEGVDRYQWALVAALLCLAVRALLSDRRPGRRTEGRRIAASALASPLVLPVVLALLLAAAPAGAQEGSGRERGLALARQARTALLAGDTAEAERLLERARVEWPDSSLLAALSGDVMVAAGSWSRARADYADALDVDDAALSHHALFNRAVAAHTATEESLTEAGVPLDPAALPEQGSPPGMLPALEAAIPALRRARDDFLEAHDLQSGETARRSILALNRRLDDLQAMLDELRRREEQEQQDQDQEQDQEQQDPNQQDQQDQQQGDSGQQGEPPPDQQDQQDQPPDEQPPEEQDQPQPAPNEPEQEQKQEQPQDQQAPSEPTEGDPTRLSPEQIQRLLEQLEDLERRARELEKARQERQHKSPEKDW